MKSRFLEHGDKKWAEGVHFGMSFEEYLSIPCLQSSSIKKLLTCETDFWVDSWMSPLKDDKDTAAYAAGRAYHVRILEGKDRFYTLYAPEFDCDMADVIKTNAQIQAELKRLEQPVTIKNAAEGIERILRVNPDAKIYDRMKAAYEAEHEGKEFLPYKTIYELEMSAKMIENNPYVRTDFIGGYPEVSILWFDDEFGVWFKIRVDYLKIAQASDLKTFANQMNKNIDRAINHAIASFSYHVAGALYLRGVEKAKQLVKDKQVFYDTKGHIFVDPDWLKDFAEVENEYFKWVFQKTGRAPASQGISMRFDTPDYYTAISKVREAAEKFKAMMAKFGTDAWVYIRPNRELDCVSDLPAYVNDI